MKITTITVKKITGQKVLRGVAGVVFDDELKVRDIKILENEKGELYIMMPSKKINDDKYVGYAYPVTEEFRYRLQEEILRKYDETD